MPNFSYGSRATIMSLYLPCILTNVGRKDHRWKEAGRSYSPRAQRAATPPFRARPPGPRAGRHRPGSLGRQTLQRNGKRGAEWPSWML